MVLRDHDLWADDDSDRHPSPSEWKDDPEFAEGFEWTCCAGPADQPLCVVARHEPLLDEAEIKRIRLKLGTD